MAHTLLAPPFMARQNGNGRKKNGAPGGGPRAVTHEEFSEFREEMREFREKVETLLVLQQQSLDALDRRVSRLEKRRG